MASCLFSCGTSTPCSCNKATQRAWNQPSALRNRFNRATSETLANLAIRARTTVSRNEYPRATCNNSVRINPSTERNPRKRTLAPVSAAKSSQPAGKKDTNVRQFFSLLLCILAPYLPLLYLTRA